MRRRAAKRRQQAWQGGGPARPWRRAAGPGPPDALDPPVRPGLPDPPPARSSAPDDAVDQGELFELRAPKAPHQRDPGGHGPAPTRAGRRTPPRRSDRDLADRNLADSDPADAGATEPLVEVRRSERRRRTVSAYRDGERTVILLPAGLPEDDEQRWVERMLARLRAQEQRRRPTNRQLLDRTLELSARFLGGRAAPTSVRWVGNQGRRWGSCTPADGSIRLSSRLQGMPTWVVDYVIVHELTHLLVPSHGPDFWALVAAYPKAERARGYLDGVAAATGLDLADDAD